MVDGKRRKPLGRLRRWPTQKDLVQRAKSVTLVLTDCDGVLTDAGVYYSDAGEMLRRFSIRDGMAVELLRNVGIDVAIVSGEPSGNIRKRAEKLHLPHTFLGIKDKANHLQAILETTGRAVHELAYIGDDVNDLEMIATIGLSGITGAPADAVPSVRSAVHYRCRNAGGSGAFREFADWILLLRGERGNS